jgi:hypothetical protein
MFVVLVCSCDFLCEETKTSFQQSACIFHEKIGQKEREAEDERKSGRTWTRRVGMGGWEDGRTGGLQDGRTGGRTQNEKQ